MASLKLLAAAKSLSKQKELARKKELKEKEEQELIEKILSKLPQAPTIDDIKKHIPQPINKTEVVKEVVKLIYRT